MNNSLRSGLRVVVGLEAAETWRCANGALERPPFPDALSPDGAPRGTRVRAVLLPAVAEARVQAHWSRSSLDWAPSGLVAEQGDYVAHCERVTLEELSTVAEANGWSIERVSHADFAWAAALSATSGTNVQGVCAVQCERGDRHVRVVRVESPNVTGLRRLPLELDDAVLESALGSLTEGRDPAGPCLALGDDDFRARIHAIALRAGLMPVQRAEALDNVGYEPEAVAAAFAGAGPEFVLPEVVAAAKKRNRRHAVASGIAATMLLIAAGALDTIDMRRELMAVERARVAHVTEVAALMDARARAADLEAATVTLAVRRAEHSRWTLLLASVADGLPEGTYLTSLVARDDSVFFEMDGTDAAVAFDAVRAIPWLRGLRSTAPVQREIGEASALRERLTASGTVSWADFR